MKTTMPSAACLESPVMKIKWRNADDLKANHWNPNFVMTPELKLLERSLLVTGWVQPVLITPLDTIIDGFHRVQLSTCQRPRRRC